MTQLHDASRETGRGQQLHALMAVGAARSVGGLEASFARIAADLANAGVVADALVVGHAAHAHASVQFLAAQMRTHRAAGWREIYGAVGRYDVVHVHGATAALWPARVVVAARLRRIPTVVTLHLPSHPPRQPRLRGELRSRARMIARGLLLLLCRADVYAPSSAAAAVAVRQLRPWPVRVAALWNGVIDPGTTPVSTGGPLRLVFIGRLADHKRPLDLVSAVEAAFTAGADVTVDIVGDGPLRGAVEAAVARTRYADRFTIHGQLEDPTSVLHRCDLLVLTSMTEGCPLVAMEAAGAGRGVLARAGVEGLAEGWPGAYIAVPAEAGTDGFATEIVRLAADRSAVAELGIQARLRYDERFSAARAAESLRAAYDRAKA